MDGAGALVRDGRIGQSTIGERLRLARRERFVGRAGELALFRDATSSPKPAFSVLFVHGPGGVGKSSLLERFAETADESGAEVARLDLGAIDPTPTAVLAELASALGLPSGTSTLDALGAGPRRVLLIDTYELAAPIDGWIRERLLPCLNADTLVVLAGRNPPRGQWLADPGWHGALRVISLRNLAPADARAYLHAEGVPAAIHERAIGLSHGHPLALSLLSELVAQRPSVENQELPAQLGQEPDLVRALLESFLDGVPSDVNLRALYACAHARFTTESLLREVLGVDDAVAPFAWLRGLSFIEEGEHGVFPHDLARDVLEAELRWRDPAAHEELHRCIYSYMARRARSAAGGERQRALMDWNFLMRTNPFTAAFVEWKSYGSVYYDRLRAEDREPLLEIAELHEGHASSELVAHWLDHQPDAFRVLRSGGEEPIGFGAVLALHKASEDQIAADPGTAAMWSYAQGHGAPRPGEEVYASRFYMDRDTYQGPSGSYNTIIAAWLEELLARERAAWEFLGFWADPQRIEPFMSYIDFHRAPEADFDVAGRRYGVFAHDWRRQSLSDWLELAARRQAAAGFDPATAERPPPVLALSAPEFAAAVRDALRDLHRPAALATNPLRDSRLVRSRDSDGPTEDLRSLIEEAVGELRGDPRDQKLYHALARTYLRPARTQELAAEALDLPLSTYKRHLRRGVERVVAALWQRELYGEGAEPAA